MEIVSKRTLLLKNLPYERKIGFILILIFATIGIVYAVLQLRNNVYGPFALNNEVPVSLKEEIIENNVGYQRTVDTDKDGLTNFDEQNVYGTSAYLYDTYGYGMSDKEVITKGLPLCPNAGKNCTEQVAPASISTSSILESVSNQTDILGEVNLESAVTPDIEKIFSDPAQIRKILLDTGRIDKKTLDKIPDTELLKMVNELINPNLSTSTLLATTSSR